MDLNENPRAVRRLRTPCEKAKRALSSTTTTKVSVDGLHKGIDLDATLTRAKFEELNRDFFEQCFGPVKQVLDDSKLKNQKLVKLY